MLAYAAENRTAARTGSPRSLFLIVAGHAVLIAAVMTVKMDLVPTIPLDPTDVINVPTESPSEPPPPAPPQATVTQPAQPSFIDRTPVIVDMPTVSSQPTDQGPAIPSWNPPVISDSLPLPPAHPVKQPFRVAAIFNTPDAMLRPPYPAAKLRLEEEATLRLRLSIDARGRVTEVEPVGRADPQFLEAARRHIIRSWRYKPATEDGVAVPFTTVVTLSFKLENG